MIDVRSEELIPVRDIPSHVPGRPSLSTVWRWILSGVGDVSLESVKIGGRRFSSVEAVQRFIDAPFTDNLSVDSSANGSHQEALRQLDEDGL